MMQLWWWEDYFLSHIMMQLWCWDCSAVPLGQFASEGVICACGVSLCCVTLMLGLFCCDPVPVCLRWCLVCVSALSLLASRCKSDVRRVSFHFPTSWCNSDVRRISFCLTSWCNSDVGRITFCLTSWCNSDDGICFLLCPWASLLQTRLSVMDVLSLCFLFHIKMQLWCWEDFFLPRIMILLWWDECHAVPLG